MNTAKPVEIKNSEKSFQPIYSFDFIIVNNKSKGDDIFKFINIDDFKSLLIDFDTRIDIDNVLNVLEKRLLESNVNTKTQFYLKLITS